MPNREVLIAAVFNAETFKDFLCYLLEHTEGRIFLILDNIRYHKAKDLKEFFFKNRDCLTRVFLPPYSPYLNLIERIWRITRRQVTHNRYFESIDELEAALSSHFAKWEEPNDTLRVLCAKIYIT
ncbi:TPA: hypothetical protein DCX16_00265 [bacterium]|nr:hypothetical protein [bacterium]